MVAVSAAAHAIDGFYGDVDEHIPVSDALRATWKKNDTPRPSRILETLRAGFRVGNRTNEWPREFRWLAGLRDAAVHHGPKFNRSAPSGDRV